MQLIRVVFTTVVGILDEGFDVLKKHRIAGIEIDTFVDERLGNSKSEQLSKGRAPQSRRVGLWMS